PARGPGDDEAPTVRSAADPPHPPEDGERDVDHLEPRVRVEAGVREQPEEQEVVRDADGEVPDVLPGRQPDARGAAHEPQDLDPAHDRTPYGGGRGSGL